MMQELEKGGQIAGENSRLKGQRKKMSDIRQQNLCQILLEDEDLKSVSFWEGYEIEEGLAGMMAVECAVSFK